eukprot:scaffold21395_cov113-Isochrysis_galbana.AAC.7
MCDRGSRARMRGQISAASHSTASTFGAWRKPPMVTKPWRASKPWNGLYPKPTTGAPPEPAQSCSSEERGEAGASNSVGAISTDCASSPPAADAVGDSAPLTPSQGAEAP